MNEGLTIVSFLWGNWCKPYQMDYVDNMIDGLKKYLSLPYKFILFWDKWDETTYHENTEFRALKNLKTWLGCLPKLKVYDPSNGFKGRVIVMDLDIVITGNLDEMFLYDGRFITRAWVKGMNKGILLSGGDMIGFEAGFGTMMWNLMERDTERLLEISNGGKERFVYRKLYKDKIDYWQLLYPNKLISYKNHIMKHPDHKLPDEARLVSCHGDPRPHVLYYTDDWIKPYWKTDIK